MRPTPLSRIHVLTQAPPRPDGLAVVYWMTSARRLSSNFALARAVDAAVEFKRPLIILEALRTDYPWASDRLHRFVLDGMAEHARALAGTPVTYLPYVEPSRGAGKGLLEALAREACLVVTDDFPAFFLPRMTAAAAARMTVRMEAVDSNGLLPMRDAMRTFQTAHAFRAHVQRELPNQLGIWPEPIDLSVLPARLPALPGGIPARWPATPLGDLEAPDRLLATLPIDHDVAPAATRGGSTAARAALRRFVEHALPRYAEDQNQPEVAGTSRLSPYLHFGHISAHEVFADVMTAEGWTSRKLAPAAGGKRTGWWGVSKGAERFLDQLVTWRELGFNMCATRPDDYDRYSNLPEWAKRTLSAHGGDARRFRYSIDELEQAATHDEVWNAAARQLARDGWMHNSLRMLWGKKILEWMPTPAAALETMTAIMNKHALDGRDPSAYAGYAWTLGRYDRAWGPERPIFGTVRYMSSANTRRKLRLKQFMTDDGA